MSVPVGAGNDREPLAASPVRLCCGQRHWGAQCPDGLVMCCLCFERFPLDELNITAGSIPEDVCKGCAKAERERGAS